MCLKESKRQFASVMFTARPIRASKQNRGINELIQIIRKSEKY